MTFLDFLLVAASLVSVGAAFACVIALNDALKRESGLVVENDRLTRTNDALLDDINVYRRKAGFGPRRIPTQRQATS